MKDEGKHAEVIRGIREVIERHSAATAGFDATASTEEAARKWLEAGFDDAEEVDEWLAARCFTAEGARVLERAGITPEQAAMRTKAGSTDYEETIAFKIVNGDLSLAEARRIITSAFWNS
jgi:HD superfamily phosphodiesterase